MGPSQGGHHERLKELANRINLAILYITMSTNDWPTFIEQFNKLGDLTRTILRNSATNRLIEDGFEEIGSSDISHELYAMWKHADKDFSKAVINEVNRFACNHR